MDKYDYVIIGSGLFGAVFAYEMSNRGRRCLVVEKREVVGGNIFSKKNQGIIVHCYGPHIFHTDKRVIWDYVNAVVPFKPIVNSPMANFEGKLYNLPFNMNTFYSLWGITSPLEVEKKLSQERAKYEHIEPKNLEEQALKLVGRDIYEKLIKGYTEKQWGRKCTELPAGVIKRIPVRLTFDNNYFNDIYQGVPFDGYGVMIERLLAKSDVKTCTDYFLDRLKWDNMAEKVVFTGCIDQFFDYKYGHLEYRSLRFEEDILQQENYQGVPVMNFTSREIPYTRITEHKHFLGDKSPVTVISKEYPQRWEVGMEPYYPVNDVKNQRIYEKYEQAAKALQNVIFGGRLGTYRYYDMDQIVEQALEAVYTEIGKFTGHNGGIK